MYSSTTSRVVPAISVTIAFFFSTRAFKRELFPVLGIPQIAHVIPLFKASPLLAVFLRASSPLFIVSSFSLSSPPAKVSMSSSGKSLETCIAANKSRRYSLILIIGFVIPPSSLFTAANNALSVFASIISFTASACVRLILPFKNALLVNSPFFAIEAPFSSSASIILSTLSGEP